MSTLWSVRTGHNLGTYQEKVPTTINLPTVGTIVTELLAGTLPAGTRLENNTIILATAHPAKFPNALEKADINLTNVPKNLQKVLNKKEISFKLSHFDNSIFEFIKDNN